MFDLKDKLKMSKIKIIGLFLSILTLLLNISLYIFVSIFGFQESDWTWIPIVALLLTPAPFAIANAVLILNTKNQIFRKTCAILLLLGIAIGHSIMGFIFWYGFYTSEAERIKLQELIRQEEIKEEKEEINLKKENRELK